ncbi:MAG: HD domain-containing phosphohydrolase [Phycisphaerae bacterium]
MTGPTTGKVLVVDDDEDLTFVLNAHLRQHGYEVAVGHNGRDAVELASTFGPDVIVMDVTMPIMNGVQATRHLKGDPATREIPVLMLTGKSRPEDVVQGFEAGAQEYIRKPFEPNELLARLATMVRLRLAQTELDELNAQLSFQIQTKTRQLELLYHFARSLNTAKSCEEVYELVTEAAGELTGSQRISLLLKNPDTQLLHCVAAQGIDRATVKRIKVSLDDGVAGQVFRSGKTLAAQAFGQGTDNSQKGRYESSTFLSTPLISTSAQSPDEVLGVLNVTERAQGDAFGQDEIDCIRSIADSAAIAIENLQQTRRLQDSVKVLLLTIGRLAEYRDEETTDHLDRVAAYARILTEALRQSPPYSNILGLEFVADLLMAVPLHDIGKVGIPDDILTKPGKLTDEEFQIMKTHTDIGRRTLEFAMSRIGRVPLMQMCVDIAYCHHERFDGTGYPRRISGQDIPLAARIVALVDAYDAITSRRRYSEPRTHQRAVEIVREESGKHFDPDVVQAFLRCADQFNDIRTAHWPDVEEPVLTGSAHAQ